MKKFAWLAMITVAMFAVGCNKDAAKPAGGTTPPTTPSGDTTPPADAGTPDAGGAAAPAGDAGAAAPAGDAGAAGENK